MRLTRLSFSICPRAQGSSQKTVQHFPPKLVLSVFQYCKLTCTIKAGFHCASERKGERNNSIRKAKEQEKPETSTLTKLITKTTDLDARVKQRSCRLLSQQCAVQHSNSTN